MQDISGSISENMLILFVFSPPKPTDAAHPFPDKLGISYDGL